MLSKNQHTYYPPFIYYHTSIFSLSWIRKLNKIRRLKIDYWWLCFITFWYCQCTKFCSGKWDKTLYLVSSYLSCIIFCLHSRCLADWSRCLPKNSGTPPRWLPSEGQPGHTELSGGWQPPTHHNLVPRWPTGEDNGRWPLLPEDVDWGGEAVLSEGGPPEG